MLRNQSAEDHDLLTYPNWGCKSNLGFDQNHNSEHLVEFQCLVKVIAKRELKKVVQSELGVVVVFVVTHYHSEKTGFPFWQIKGSSGRNRKETEFGDVVC